jgi:hypothetical protein
LLKRFTGTTLHALEHFRYGCPGALAQEQLTGTKRPVDFSCPVCMQEKNVSMSSASTTIITLLSVGARIQLDLGFYKVESIRGFKCFLMAVEAHTPYHWHVSVATSVPPLN